MSDRELLEFAAKAGGYSVKWHPGLNAMAYLVGYTQDAKHWAPMTNAGDALRLAVECELDVSIEQGNTQVAWQNKKHVQWIDEPHNTSTPLLATCRAIVRAAAEVGK